MNAHQIAVERLRELLKKSQTKNPRFTLRAFAQKLRLHPGTLSSLLNGKRQLSEVQWKKVLELARIPDWEREAILQLLKKPSRTQRAKPPKRQRVALSKVAFSLISDGIHYAILCLLEMARSPEETSPTFLSRRLGATPTQVQKALETMKNLGMTERTVEGRWRATGFSYDAPDGIPSDAVREFHRQALETASSAIEGVPMELRDLSAVTVAANPALLPLARMLIRDFRKTLTEILQTGEKTEVYRLTLQLIPLTK